MTRTMRSLCFAAAALVGCIIGCTTDEVSVQRQADTAIDPEGGPVTFPAEDDIMTDEVVCPTNDAATALDAIVQGNGSADPLYQCAPSWVAENGWAGDWAGTVDRLNGLIVETGGNPNPNTEIQMISGCAFITGGFRCCFGQTCGYQCVGFKFGLGFFSDYGRGWRCPPIYPLPPK